MDCSTDLQLCVASLGWQEIEDNYLLPCELKTFLIASELCLLVKVVFYIGAERDSSVVRALAPLPEDLGSDSEHMHGG